MSADMDGGMDRERGGEILGRRNENEEWRNLWRDRGMV